MKSSVKIYGGTDMGRVRRNNEDAFICQHIWDDSHVLCAAIDGLGGYEGGEVAAEIARTTIISYLNDFAFPEYGQLLKGAVIEANNEIVRQHQARPKVSQMGCVASVGLFDLSAGFLYIAHVGDSRIYQFSDGVLKKLTHDHSLVGYREEIGEMTEEAAMHHPRRNVIDRYLGECELPADTDGYIEMSIFPLHGDARYLFCSDGLTDMITSAQIKEILSEGITVEGQVKSLIAKANEAGGKDNVTVVIADITECREEKAPEDNPVPDSDAEAITDIPHGRKSKRRIWPQLLCFIVGIAVGASAVFVSGAGNKTDKKAAAAALETSTIKARLDSVEKQVAILEDSVRTLVLEKEKSDSLILEAIKHQ